MKFLVGRLEEAWLERLRKAAPEVELVVAEDGEDAVRKVVDCEGAFNMHGPELLRAGLKLRWIHVTLAGVDTVLYPDLVESDIVLTNGKRIQAIEIADHLFALLLCFTRGVREFLPCQHEGRFGKPSRFPIYELNEMTILLIGFGGIGQEAARRANSFRMRILALDIEDTTKPDYVEYVGKPDEFHDLLSGADFVASCVPLTAKSHRMIDANALAAMKQSAYLINVSRGGVVDTDALVTALENNEIAGAALDVTDPEPLPEDHPLWRMDNVIITPHIATRSHRIKERVIDLLCENLRRFAANQPLLNIVNKQEGY